MKRNKPKKTHRGRTIIKQLKDSTVLLPGGARYKVGVGVRHDIRGITPIKRKGKVGNVGYSIDDVSDLMDYKPEGVEVGHGVGFTLPHGVGNWKTYTYDPAACVMGHTHSPAKPSAWTSWVGLFRQYGRELRDALRWFFALPSRVDLTGSKATPAPGAPLGFDSVKEAPGLAPDEAIATPGTSYVSPSPAPSPFPELDPRKVSAWAAGKDLTKPKRKRKPRKG
jgi:hypothetical protein